MTSNSQEPKREITAAENALGPRKDLGPRATNHRHALQRTQGPEITVTRRPRFRNTDNDQLTTPKGSERSNKAATTATIAADQAFSETSTEVDRNQHQTVLLGRARAATHPAQIEAEAITQQAPPVHVTAPETLIASRLTEALRSAATVRSAAAHHRQDREAGHLRTGIATAAITVPNDRPPIPVPNLARSTRQQQRGKVHRPAA